MGVFFRPANRSKSTTHLQRNTTGADYEFYIMAASKEMDKDEQTR